MDLHPQSSLGYAARIIQVLTHTQKCPTKENNKTEQRNKSKIEVLITPTKTGSWATITQVSPLFAFSQEQPDPLPKHCFLLETQDLRECKK